VLDLTERKRAEYLIRPGLRASPDRNLSSDPITGFSGDPAFERRWGMPPETFIREARSRVSGWKGFEQTAKAYSTACSRERKSVTPSGSTQSIGGATSR